VKHLSPQTAINIIDHAFGVCHLLSCLLLLELRQPCNIRPQQS
jgi:hypothetical protein